MANIAFIDEKIELHITVLFFFKKLILQEKKNGAGFHKMKLKKFLMSGKTSIGCKWCKRKRSNLYW